MNTSAQDRIADQGVTDSLELISLVRDYGPDLIGDFLTRRSRNELYALTVVLAAMVPDDQSIDQLLDWVRPKRPTAPPRTPRELRPHGTHAAFARHRSLGEEPCAACWNGERLYQRDAARRKRARAT